MDAIRKKASHSEFDGLRQHLSDINSNEREYRGQLQGEFATTTASERNSIDLILKTNEKYNKEIPFGKRNI